MAFELIKYVIEVRTHLRDIYKIVPSKLELPDGEYPMVINGKTDYVFIKDGAIKCYNFKDEV